METKVTWPFDTVRTKKTLKYLRGIVSVLLLTGSSGFNVTFWPEDGKDLKCFETLCPVNVEKEQGVS